MKAVILARVSRGERTQDPEAQVTALQAAAQRHGWQVVDVVRRVQSGWTEDDAREVEEAALLPIKEGRADVLMVWALDRLVRTGPLGALRCIGNLEKHLGAKLFSLQEPFLSTAADPATRELLLPIIAWVAKQESQRKSERLQAKAHHKRQTAERLGQRARWGRGQMPTQQDVQAILAAKGQKSVRALAQETGLSVGTVHNILQGKRGA